MTHSANIQEIGATRDAASVIFTIGHSNRTLEEFVDLLLQARVSMVVDVRKIPRSRSNPQFNLDSLPDALRLSQIQHQYLSRLGGRRSKSRDVPEAVNGFWRNQSFHNYADYALTQSFREGLDELIALSRHSRCAIMCSEAVWWRCHRRIIADHLISNGIPVQHIMGSNRIEDATMTPSAVKLEGILRYPEPEQVPTR